DQQVGGGYTAAKYGAVSGPQPRRGGNLGRQPCDFPFRRRRKPGNGAAKGTTRSRRLRRRLWRLRRARRRGGRVLGSRRRWGGGCAGFGGCGGVRGCGGFGGCGRGCGFGCGGCGWGWGWGWGCGWGGCCLSWGGCAFC